MNLVYVCVFHQESYINLLELLIRSISVNGNIKNTDILILTSPSFHPLIQKSLEKFELPLSFYILDLHTLFESGCARLNIFKYANIDAYDKILYLDTDILINSDMNKLFDLDISPKKLYAMEEGYIGENVFNWWGHDFFDFTNYDRNTPAFTSGILLFKNSEFIKTLFEKVQSHITNYVGKIPCGLDQPFLVYNAIIENKYDNKVLNTYVENSPTSVSPDKIIYHFPGDPGSYNSKMEKMTAFWDLMNDFSFITLSSSGYIKYTLNCLRSLKKLNMNLHSYVVGKEGYDKLKEKGYRCTLIEDESLSHFHHYNCKTWSDITFHKFDIIYKNLLRYKYVLFTDGDIVFEKPFLDYLRSMGDYEMLVQSEGTGDKALCSGFMYIKSTETTLSLFNPANVEKHKIMNPYRNGKNWNDQWYLNDVKEKCHYTKLPLDLFPNGKHYYEHHNLDPYLIHFNWVVGDEKETRMKKYGKWYENVNVCHHSTDGFGHQLEGMLRLIALSLNDKANYVYDFKKKFLFDHSNYDNATLTSYLLKALELLKPSCYVHKKYNVVYENKSFKEIKETSDNIYCYDGVSTGDPKEPNFEHMKDTKKTLPMLRKAFVLDNPFLPEPSYKTPCIVCHIRLGDAIGQRNLDTINIFNFIKKMQKTDNHIVIHTDGDVSFLKSENTTICDKKTDVLQILSDFIHAEVLVMNYSSLSMAAHLLASETQEVFCPNFADELFFNRILDKCKKINTTITILNKTYSWEQCTLTFLEGGVIKDFGGGNFTQDDSNVFQAYFGGRMHRIVFNEDCTEFVSTRKDDGAVVEGKLIKKI